MRIELAPDLERRFRKALRQAGRREIGGILLAEQLALSNFRVVDFSLDSFSGSYTKFQRDPKAHQKTLDEFFSRTGRDFERFNCIGEWHSHPSFPIYPSREDIGTMTDIVENRGSVISFAVLLILRLRWRLWLDYSLTVFARGQAPRQAQIRRRVVFI
jgi:hypothetical protein